MPRFGRSSPSARDRTPEERARDRAEREQRRASREGRAADPHMLDANDLEAPLSDVQQPAAEPALAPDPARVDPPLGAHQARQDLGWPDEEPQVPASPDYAPGSQSEPEPAAYHEPVPEPTPSAYREPDPEPSAETVPPPLPPSDSVPAAIRIESGGGAEPIVEAGGTAPPAPPRRRRRRGSGQRPEGSSPAGRARIVRRVVAGVVVGLIVAVLYFAFETFQPFHGSGHGQVTVVVPKGASVHQIGDELASRGVVASGFFFYLHARLSGGGSNIRPGSYSLQQDMSYSAALTALHKGPTVARTITITIVPGMDRAGIARLARADGLTGSYLVASAHSALLNPRRYGAPRGVSLEGFLFPDTFQLRVGATSRQLVDEQLADFKRHFATINLGEARRLHLTAYDVITVASMVEKEASLNRERPLIAAVIYNRLRGHTPLGIDATVLYGLGGDFTRPLTTADLARDTPYNTRLHQGLPPTPISSPALASLVAAAHPAHVPYLYYVVKPGTCGEDAFTTSYQQFLRDAQRYQSAKAANGGRAPQHC